MLQSHVDMVCQKNEATEFDFMTQGIRMLVDGDCGVPRALHWGRQRHQRILAVLESSDIPHLPLKRSSLSTKKPA